MPKFSLSTTTNNNNKKGIRQTVALGYRNKGYAEDAICDHEREGGVLGTGEGRPDGKEGKEIHHHETDERSTTTRRENQCSVGITEKCGKGDEIKENEASAPEGVWGYVVALGCFGSSFVLGPCFGTIFSDFLLELDTSTTTVTWIYNSGNFIWCSSLLLMGPVVKKYGWRRAAMAGALLSSLGMGLSAFATSAWFLLFSYSFMARLGSGILFLISNIILPHYFVRHRGLSFAFLGAGSCASQMGGPLLITRLQEEYGYRGSTLVLAALLLNCCVAAFTFHPVEWHKGTRAECGDAAADEREGDEGCCLALRRVFCSLATSFKFLRSPKTLILVFGACFIQAGYLNFFSIVPFVMVESGYTQEEASWCLGVSGACNLVTRLVVLPLSDWPKCSKRALYMVGTATMALTTSVYTSMRGLDLLATMMGLWGFGGGTCISIINLLIIEYSGLEHYATVFGIVGLMSGVWLLIFGPIFGLVKDLSGSYTVSLSVLAATEVLTFILWSFMPVAVAYEQRKKLQKEEEQQQRKKQQQKKRDWTTAV